MDTEVKEGLLKTLPFWDSLTEKQKNDARSGSRMAFFKKGSPVHNRCCGQGECLGMLIIKTGEVRTFILSSEGREVTIFRLFNGDVCLFSESCVIKQMTSDTHIVAEKDTYALIFSDGVLTQVMAENINVERYIYASSINRFSAVMGVFQRLLFTSLEQRVAGFLFDEYKRTGDLVIRLTHEQVAKHTGSAREVVSRTLKSFAGNGLVELRRGSIVLLDAKKLEKICQ